MKTKRINCALQVYFKYFLTGLANNNEIKGLLNYLKRDTFMMFFNTLKYTFKKSAHSVKLSLTLKVYIQIHFKSYFNNMLITYKANVKYFNCSVLYYILNVCNCNFIITNV